MSIPSFVQQVRTQERLTLNHLARLASLAEDQHREFTRSAKRGGKAHHWSDRRMAVVLAQGGALHYLHPATGYGVKDLDLWTFYAHLPGRPLRSGRYEVHRDFGPSDLGRNFYPAPLSGKQRTFDLYEGRRVDFLVRELPVTAEADSGEIEGAIRRWLAQGAAQACTHAEGGRNSSAHWLAHKAMVLVWARGDDWQLGAPLWDGEVDAPHLGRAPSPAAQRRTGSRLSSQ